MSIKVKLHGVKNGTIWCEVDKDKVTQLKDNV